MKFSWRSLLFENISYKLVALFISLILWFSILGRRDFQVTKSVEVDLSVAQGFVVEQQSADFIKVRVAGPRTALQKFIQGGASQIVNIDMTQYRPGHYRLSIPLHKLDIPFGVKVISIKPTEIEVKLRGPN